MIEIAVRCGGHSLARHSVTEGGIVLDLRDMRALEIDAAAGAGDEAAEAGDVVVQAPAEQGK